ncbi:MAG: hypothetical protein LBO72_09945 [Helicobacteraceae bacterium]|jgi:hypothetical protein|nr:hypothetical protein [Helicobacteraceae bacterium]
MKTRFCALLALALGAIVLTACDAQSRTQSGATQTAANEKYATLLVGEQRDIELPIAYDPTYAISSATTSEVGSDVNLTNSRNVNYLIADISASARPVLRLVGAYPGKEAIAVQTVDRGTGQVSTLRVIVTVAPSSSGNDVIGGPPCVPPQCGDGGGGDDDDDDDGDDDIGDKPIVDPDACTSAGGFYYIDDNYQDVEGKFGLDFAAYIRSLMSGNVDSNIRLFYLGVTNKPAQISYVNMGRYHAVLPDSQITVEFDLQLAQFLFGLQKKYFYVETNGYCLRGEIPSSVMSPPSKKLTWVVQP